MEDYCDTNKKSPKLDEFNSSLKFKLKLPKHEQDLAPSNQNINKLITSNQDEQVVENQGDVKVATPPQPPTSEKTEDGDVVGEVKLRICPYCNKGFSNGKALGGHMRIHAVNYKSNKKINPNKNDMLDVKNQEVFKCTLCPKEFPSIKSLFGHMRSHPDRFWRGMNPPRHLAAASMAAASDVGESSTMAEDRLKSLGTWRVTGKRGRKAYSSSLSSPVTSTSSASSRSHDEVAADLILLLAGGRRDDDDYEVKKAKKGKGLMLNNHVAVNYDVHGNNKLFDEDEVYYLKNLGFLPNYKLDNVDDNINKFDDDKVAPIVMVSPKIKGVKKIIGKVNKSDYQENMENNHNHQDEINTNKWVCNTCGKSFPTHQALGGHRSSHNKDKYNNNNNTIGVQTRVVDGSGLTNTDPISGNNNNGNGNAGGEEGHQVEVVTNLVHKCKICNKTFASGQALGGHQRCHYVNGSDFLSTQSSGQTGHLDRFDLNVEPPMIDDDDDAGDVTFDSISNQYGSF